MARTEQLQRMVEQLRHFAGLMGPSQFLETVFRQQRESHVPNSASSFRLIDVLADVAQEAVDGAETERLSPESPLFAQLRETLQTQLQAALKEHLQAPYHSDANEVDLPHYQSHDDLKIFHRHYWEVDLLERCQRAVEAAQGPRHRERFALERDQVAILYQEKLLPELRSEDLTTTWVPAVAGETLSREVMMAYAIADDADIYLGQKHAFVMPANVEVHRDGLSYVNVYQLAYLPHQHKVIVLMDQYYDEIDLAQHAALLTAWEPDALPPQAILSEELIMTTVVSLPEEVRTSPAFAVFAELSKQIEQTSQDTNYRTKQQTALANLARSRETITQGATFLAHVLTAEYLVCSQHPAALQSLSQRLSDAFEMVAHPLFTGNAFAGEQVKNTYIQMHLQPWIAALQQQPSADQQGKLARDLVNLQRQRALLDRAPSTQEQQQRDRLMQAYSQDYPAIFNRVFSQAQCAAGSFGGLAQLQSTASSSLGQSVLNGQLLNQSELARMIGQTRAQEWKLGTCANPSCRNGGVEQMVGECGLCLRCELESELGQLNSESTDQPMGDTFDAFARQSFLNPEQVRDYYQRHFRITVDELPTFVLAENHVSTHTR